MRFVVFLSFIAALQAQTAPLEAQCTLEDVRQLDLECSVQRPCPIYLEIAGVEPIGNKIFLSGNLHTRRATLSSILLASRDGGLTWFEPHARIRGAALEQIQFIDHDHGWIGGQTVQPATHDPFLLITSDGGDSWHMRPVVDDESRKGAIERFWFTSRTTGSLLLDRMHAGESGGRHELYESMTGGESWTMLRTSADPIALEAPTPDQRHTDWRVRADAETNSFRVESRDADAWRTIAAFPIQPGECGPADTPPAPSEPPEIDEPENTPAPTTPERPAARPTLRKKPSRTQ